MSLAKPEQNANNSLNFLQKSNKTVTYPTKLYILTTFCNTQNVIIISTDVTMISGFSLTQKGVMLPVSLVFNTHYTLLAQFCAVRIENGAHDPDLNTQYKRIMDCE